MFMVKQRASSSSSSGSWAAICSVVVPTSRMMQSPGWIMAAARLPMRTLASFSTWVSSSRSYFFSRQASPRLTLDTSTPLTFFTSPPCSTAARSRRTVISDTPKVCASSRMGINPLSWTSSTIRFHRTSRLPTCAAPFLHLNAF